MTGLELRLTKEVLLYANMDEYRQLSQIFVSQGKLLINTSYVYSQQLLWKMTEFFDVEVAPVQADEIEDMLKDISLAEAENAVEFLTVAKKVLEPYGCAVEMKQFIPANLPAFYYMNEDAKLYQDIKKAQEEADDIFLEMLSNFAGEVEKSAKAILYFNMRNPIVRKMTETEDVKQLEDVIMVLYVQTLLIGGYPLRNNELGLMNDKLLRLMEKAFD